MLHQRTNENRYVDSVIETYTINPCVVAGHMTQGLMVMITQYIDVNTL